ncbi:MAG: hypothetical protein KME15_19880 [Drouetiella hepatica Uher 2000/2452]|uniref:Uncharacterized protein n=1 Tax=Drouetiella hepatica Uher 2000/2452 TaxID=904376 RepID=A0A951QE23_9CYAN|nr:hypothetical protein [Drouetiella hepatica Uher 2000/2452]
MSHKVAQRVPCQAIASPRNQQRIETVERQIKENRPYTETLNLLRCLGVSMGKSKDHK